ncbi:MAG: glycosyltransferase [Chloroflexota bacterium]|nr:glycosyltransferase [Dehalococcoidia bacterium]MDW8046265.1 glycosyltransferase [Chloroflexota bacterium]
MTRILHLSVHTSPLAPLGGRDAGGMNVYVLELARALGQLGYEVDVMTRLDGDLPPIEPLGPNVRLLRLAAGPPVPLPKDDVARYGGEFAREALRFAAREGRGYHLIHSHYWQSARVGLALARAWEVPHAVMFHTLGAVKNRARVSEAEPRRRIAAERLAARRADAVVTASRHERELLVRDYGADPARLVTIPCGLDLELFSPRDRAQARSRLGIPSEPPLLVWVGRLEPLKGVDILIDAFAQLQRQDALLWLVGGDSEAAAYRAVLEAQARARGVTGRVCFAGPMPHAELPWLYSAADVCVVPSYYESFGLVAVEAMACGTPVVASRVGGLAETVIDGVTGYLIPWRCPEPFAEKLDVLLANPELRANFGRAGRRAAERFRWPSVAARIASLYEALRAGQRRGARFRDEIYEATLLAGGQL